MTLLIGSASGTAGGAAPFAPFTHYDANQLVQHNGNLYAAPEDFTSGAEFDATDWTTLATGPAAAAAPQITGLLGLPVVAEITETFDHNLTQDHTAHDTPAGMAAATQATYEVPRRLVKDVGEIRFVYVNTAAVNITVRCGLGRSANGADPIEGYFDGKRSVVIEPGGFAVSDAIPADLTAGSIIYERCWVQVSSGSWKITATGAPAATACEIGADETATGTLSGIGTRPFCAAFVIGPSAGSTLAGLFSDSIGWGSGDTGRATGAGLGFVARACGPANVPLLNLGKPLETAQAIASDATVRSGRWRFIGAVGKAVFAYGINDTDAGRTAAQVKADFLTVALMLQRRNIPTYFCTITPHSTDAVTQRGTDGARVTVNQWLRANAPIDPVTKAAVAIGTPGALLAGQDGHPIADVFDVCATVESAQDSGLWKTPVSGTATTVNGSPTLTGATGAWLPGMTISGTGIPAQAAVGTVVGSTLTLVNQYSGASINATASASGVAITSGTFTNDFLHPQTTAHAAMATAIDTTKLL